MVTDSMRVQQLTEGRGLGAARSVPASRGTSQYIARRRGGPSGRQFECLLAVIYCLRVYRWICSGPQFRLVSWHALWGHGISVVDVFYRAAIGAGSPHYETGRCHLLLVRFFFALTSSIKHRLVNAANFPHGLVESPERFLRVVVQQVVTTHSSVAHLNAG